MSTKQKIHQFTIILGIILSTNCFSLHDFGGREQKFLYYPIILYMTYIVLITKTSIYKNFSKPILLTSFCIFFSAIPCYIHHNQNILGTLFAVFSIGAGFIFYYYLHAIKISEIKLFHIFTIIALAICFIQIFQQIFPEHAIFGIPSENDILEGKEIESRNGLLRFRLSNIYAYPVLFYSWCRILKKISIRYLLIFILMLISIYLQLSRQVMLATLATLIIGISFINKVNKKNKWFLLFLGIILLIINYNSLFGELVSQSNEEINNEDYIRYISANYFFNESFISLLTILWGHSIPVGGSSYELFVQNLSNIGFFASDVGFIGAAYNYGWIVVVVFYFIVYKLIFKYKVIPPYIRMTIITIVLYSIMIFTFVSKIGVVFFSCILYLSDLYINRSK